MPVPFPLAIQALHAGLDGLARTQHFSGAADALLACFDFIPHARIDDVMASYAVPGGGVGPHVDSYDVFLLQGHGRRRWQISRQKDTRLRAGLELKVLERFVPEEEWILEAGDMLYLPPGSRPRRGRGMRTCRSFPRPGDASSARFLDLPPRRLSRGALPRLGRGSRAHPG